MGSQPKHLEGLKYFPIWAPETPQIDRQNLSQLPMISVVD